MPGVPGPGKRHFKLYYKGFRKLDIKTWFLSQHTNTDGTDVAICRPGNTKLTPVSTSHMSDADTLSFTMYNTQFFSVNWLQMRCDDCKAGFIYKWTSEELPPWGFSLIMIPSQCLDAQAQCSQLHGRVSTGEMSETTSRSQSRSRRSHQPGPEVGLNTVITRENITWEWGHGEKLFEWSMQTINEGGSVASK